MIEPAVEALCHVVLEVPFKIVALFLPCSTDFVGLSRIQLLEKGFH